MDYSMLGGSAKSGWIKRLILDGEFDYSKLKKDVRGKENILKFSSKVEKQRMPKVKLTWIEYVKQYAQNNGIGFKDAMKSKKCKEEYHNHKKLFVCN